MRTISKIKDKIYGHGSHIHFLIFFLKNSKIGSNFMLSGIKFRNCGPL